MAGSSCWSTCDPLRTRETPARGVTGMLGFLAFACALGCGLMAGFFLAFSNCVMKSLADGKFSGFGFVCSPV